MADKGRGGTDKRKDEKKKRKLNLPQGPRLVAEEASESNSPLRTRASRPTVTVAAAGTSGQIPHAIPMRSGGQGTTEGDQGAIGGGPINVELVDSDKDMPEEAPLSKGKDVRGDTTSPPNYFRHPSSRASVSGTKPINPVTGVEYLCIHGKDLLRSGEISGYGKMSNVDRIRHGQANLLQVMLLAFVGLMLVCVIWHSQVRRLG